jgi:peptidoglycan-N-acetylglucosamine deacetylase
MGRQTDRLSGAALRAVSGSRRYLPSGDELALTFDDGPQPPYTDRILEVLARYGVRATFFMVGRSACAYPQLARAVADAGHAVGSHSATHPDPRALSAKALALEFRTGRAMVEDVIGRAAPLFRVPQGFLSAGVTYGIRRTHTRSWLWSIDTRDHRRDASARDIAEAKERLSPRAVVLMHDGLYGTEDVRRQDRTPTIEALPALIERALERGLTFVTLD